MKYSLISNQIPWIGVEVSARVPVSNKKSKSQASSHPASASVTFCCLLKNCIFVIEASQTFCVHGEWKGLTLIAAENPALGSQWKCHCCEKKQNLPRLQIQLSSINWSLTNSPRPPRGWCQACRFISSHFFLPLVWPNWPGLFAALVRAGMPLLPAASCAKRRHRWHLDPYCRWLCTSPDKSSPSGLTPSRGEAK